MPTHDASSWVQLKASCLFPSTGIASLRVEQEVRSGSMTSWMWRTAALAVIVLLGHRGQAFSASKISSRPFSLRHSPPRQQGWLERINSLSCLYVFELKAVPNEYRGNFKFSESFFIINGRNRSKRGSF